MILRVESVQDPRLEDYTRLTDVALRRRIEPERGVFMAESSEVIGRALDAGMTPRSVLMEERFLWTMAELLERFDPAVPVYVGAPEVLRAVTGFSIHRGALAAMWRPALPGVAAVVSGARRVAVLEDIVDHTNVGAIFRGAAGLGVDAVLVSPSCADPLYRRSVRVSMGTVFQVPWTRLEPWPGGLDALRAEGFEVAALTLAPDAVDLDAYAARPGFADRKLALLLGTEGHGLSARAVDLADLAVRIPMSGGVDSLNVAAAAAVAFWATR
ncbi:MAG: RNA methyltransferase [Bifidobacteriaceae bacterium]|jgi:tRNA G18 (ribose-2'-O)-methylase SpoU|nr:RNA methyltransferase [Bifidobacteriaceae bacterium]